MYAIDQGQTFAGSSSPGIKDMCLKGSLLFARGEIPTNRGKSAVQSE